MVPFKRFNEADLLDVPQNIDEDFIAQLDYTDPIAKASVWLHKHLIKCIHNCKNARDWYDGKTKMRPKIMMSDMLVGEGNTLCDRFRYYSDQMLLYRPGHIPRDIVKIDYRCARILVARLFWCHADPALIRRTKNAFEQLENLVMNDDVCNMPLQRYGESIEAAIKEIVDTFNALSASFAAIEHNIENPPPKPDVVTKSDIRLLEDKTDRIETKVDEVNATTHRIDSRDKRSRKGAKARYTAEQQDKAYQYWEIGRQSQSVKESKQDGGRVGYADVFAYYRRELAAIGITDVKAFKMCLKARRNSIYYRKSTE